MAELQPDAALENEGIDDTVETPDEVVELDEGAETTPAIDYAAELEKAKRETEERMGKKLDHERAKRIEAEKAKGLPPEEVESIIEKRLADSEARLSAKFERELNEAKARELAGSLAGSTAERDLILHHYNSSIVPTGNLAEDIRKAHAIANAPKQESRINELKATALSKANRTGGSEAGEKVEEKPRGNFSKEDIEVVKELGLSPEQWKQHLARKEKYK